MKMLNFKQLQVAFFLLQETVALSVISVISPGLSIGLQVSVCRRSPLDSNVAVYFSAELRQEGYAEKWLGCLSS